jgi:outer membrane biogenesis lipoprotein LolB
MSKPFGAILALACLLLLGACTTTAPAGDAAPPADLVDDAGGIGGY